MARPSSLEGKWLRFVEALGGVEVAASVVGVDRRTLHRWAHGHTEPSNGYVATVREIARRAGVRAPV